VICLHDYLYPRQHSKVVLEVFCVISEPWVRDHVSTLLESISVCGQYQALESESQGYRAERYHSAEDVLERAVNDLSMPSKPRA
jgi:hypothetical protein